MKPSLLRDGIYFAAFTFALVLLARWLPATMLADEYVHWPQVVSFSQGSWSVNPWLSTWPTMNFIVSLPVRLTDTRELWLGRVVVASSGGVAFVGYLKLLHAIHGNSLTAGAWPGAGLRALQFFCAPVILLFTSIIYTDIPALAALVWAAYAVLSRRRALLLFAAAMTVALRQSHIVWFVALMLWHGWLLHREQIMSSATDQRAASRFNLKGCVAACFDVFRGDIFFWLAAAGLSLCWLAIVQLTGGVAYGANTQVGHFVHVAGFGNMCFSMVVLLLVFFPVMAATLATRPIAWSPARVLLLVAVVALIAVGFQATLPGNVAPEAQVLLRNRLLAQLSDPLGRVAMIAACAMGLLAWIKTDFAPQFAPLKWPLLAFSALYLLPFGLIEQRYYIPMFALFWAARKPQPIALEWTQLAWCVALSAMLVYQVTYKGKFL